MRSRRFPYTFAECMDVFDWFDSPDHDYLYHIMVSKLDAKARLKRAMPEIRKRARRLLDYHRDTECAYPLELLNRPA